MSLLFLISDEKKSSPKGSNLRTKNGGRSKGQPTSPLDLTVKKGKIRVAFVFIYLILQSNTIVAAFNHSFYFYAALKCTFNNYRKGS